MWKKVFKPNRFNSFSNFLFKSNMLKSVKSWVFDMQWYRYSDRALKGLQSDIDLLIIETKEHIFSFSETNKFLLERARMSSKNMKILNLFLRHTFMLHITPELVMVMT